MIEANQLQKEFSGSSGDVYRRLDLYVVEKGIKREIELDTHEMSFEDNELDDIYLMNVMLRQANFKLRNTRFEKIAWKIMHTESQYRKGVRSFIKEIDKYIYADYCRHD